MDDRTTQHRTTGPYQEPEWPRQWLATCTCGRGARCNSRLDAARFIAACQVPRLMGPSKIQLRSSSNGQYYLVAVGANGEDGPVSETYTRKVDAIRAAREWWPGVYIEDTETR